MSSEERRYTRDWSKYDENLITRYEMIFPYYVFEHWYELLEEDNKKAKTRPYKAPLMFNQFLAFLYVFFTYREIEGILRALYKMGIIPVYLDYKTIHLRLKNMQLDFNKVKDEVELISDGTGISVEQGGRYIRAKWKKGGKGKFLKIVVHVDANSMKVLKAEVENSEVKSAVKVIKEVSEGGGRVTKFYGDKAYDSNAIYDLVPEVVIPPKRSANVDRASPRRRDTILEYRESPRDWSRKRGYGKRWRVEVVISAVKRMFGDGIRARGVLQGKAALLKFWVYHVMREMADFLVGEVHAVRVA
ncbi:transposase [Sulfolobus tengchongensis]|uniref:Transposase n=1 Tax=Sulfolobus tengchongensis TaxID=207809 RepID=A0AAX4L1U6_9CREN